MAGLFLTTAALHVHLIWPESALGRAIADAPLLERWVSPLSHAILWDSFHTWPLTPQRRKLALRAVESHRRQMLLHWHQYQLPDSQAVDTWSKIRGIEVDIPPYGEGDQLIPGQTVGPDELLIFATAAALEKPLLGPAPADAEVLDYLADYGITFAKW